MSTFPTCSREFADGGVRLPAFPGHQPGLGWFYLGTTEGVVGGRSHDEFSVDWYVNTHRKLTRSNVYSFMYAVSYGSGGRPAFVSQYSSDLDSFFKNWQQALLDLVGVKAEPR